MGSGYYSLLGVEKPASQEALRRAYRRRILEVHPDHNPGNVSACERTRQIVEAYHVLSDPVRRRVYDLATYQTDEPRHIVTRPHRGEYLCCPQWAIRVCVVLIFLGVVAAVGYGVQNYLDNRTVVFRPQLGTIDLSSNPSSPRLLGRSIAPRVNTQHEHGLASSVVAKICLDTAICADREACPGFALFATLTPPASL